MNPGKLEVVKQEKPSLSNQEPRGCLSASFVPLVSVSLMSPSMPRNDLGGEAPSKLLPAPPAPTPAHFQGLKVSSEKLIAKFIAFSQ